MADPHALNYETPQPPERVTLARRLKWLLIACATYFILLLTIVLFLTFAAHWIP